MMIQAAWQTLIPCGNVKFKLRHYPLLVSVRMWQSSVKRQAVLVAFDGVAVHTASVQ